MAQETKRQYNKAQPPVNFRCDAWTLECFDAWRERRFRNWSRGDVIRHLMVHAMLKDRPRAKLTFKKRILNFFRKNA